MNNVIRYSSWLIFVISMIIILGAIYPYFFGSGVTIYNDPAGSTLNPRDIPSYYRLSFPPLYDWVKSIPAGYKTMIYPGKIPYSTTSSKHPAVYGNYYNHPPLLEFANYLWIDAYGHRSVRNRRLTDEYAKILGLLNIRDIIVVPESEPMWGIMPNDRRENIIETLNEQKGLIHYYPSENLHHYHNPLAIPLIYAPSSAAMVVGGLGTLLQAAILGIDFSKWALFFSSQIEDGGMDILRKVDTIVLSGKNIDDLILNLIDKRYQIDLWNYAVFSSQGLPTDQRSYDYHLKRKVENEWIRYFSSYWTSYLGDLAKSKKGLIRAVGSNKDKPLNIRVKISKDGLHEIWIRAGVGHGIWGSNGLEEVGEFSVHLDGVLLKYINTKMEGTVGLKWIRLSSIYMSKGEHDVWIENRRGVNSLDKLIIIPAEEIQILRQKAIDIMKGKRWVFLYEGEKDFIGNSQDWKVEFAGGSASEGCVYRTYIKDALLVKQINLPADMNLRFAFRVSSHRDLEDKIEFSIDGKKVPLSLEKRGGTGALLKWIEAGPVMMKEGDHEIVFHKMGEGKLDLDLVVIYSDIENAIGGIFQTKNRESPLSWTMVSSTKYILKQKMPRYKFIIFNQNFHPEWKIFGDNKTIPSYQVNGWANGFLIDNEVSNEELNIIFDMQKYTSLGFYISTIFLVMVTGYLFFSSRFIKSIISRWRR